MQKHITLRLWIGVLALLFIVPLQAQPGRETNRGPRVGMRREGMQRNPQMQVGRLVMGIGLLEKNGQHPLSAKQAKEVVRAVTPWRKKSSMTATQAGQLESKLTALLTGEQKKELQALRPPRRDNARGRSRGRGREGRAGMQRRTPPTAAERQKRRAGMEKLRQILATYNPFYPPTKYSYFKEMPERMQENAKRRFAAQEAVLKALEKKAAKA